MNDEELAKAINDSGFPLQIGLNHLAISSGWRASSEHPWRDFESGDDEKFIDIILRPGGDSPIRFVVECKRAHNTDWIFLRERSSEVQELVMRARIVAQSNDSNHQTPIDEWSDVPFVPGSAEASFCVIRKNGQRSQELLEKTAAEVVRATDALAYQESSIYHRLRMGAPGLQQIISRVYVPMIVTTAKMILCDADYEAIDVNTGEITVSASVESPVLRFAKSLAAGDPKKSSVISVGRFAAQSKRSVLIVQASNFAHLLKTWDLGKRGNRFIDRLQPDGT